MELSQLATLARKWIIAMNEHIVEDVLALYADDARHISPALRAQQPETNGIIYGKDALRSWWTDAFKRLPTLRYCLQTITAQAPNRVVIEYQRLVDGEEPFLVAEVFELNNDGFIQESRVYRG